MRKKKDLLDRILENPTYQIRFISVMAICLFVVLILCFAKTSRQSMDLNDYEKTYYCVKEGDTFWTISKKFCPETLDIRVYMDKIISLNGYEGRESSLQYNTTIEVYKLK